MWISPITEFERKRRGARWSFLRFLSFRPFQPASSIVCVVPQHAMATLLQEFMSGVGKHGIGIEKQCPILFITNSGKLQYCIIKFKMGSCFSLPIPCFQTPDINVGNNVAIACCGSTQTVDSDSDSNAGWKGRRKEGEGGRRTDRLKKLYKFAILTVYAVHQQLSKTIQKQQWEIQVRDEEIGRLTLELEDKKTQIRRLE